MFATGRFLEDKFQTPKRLIAFLAAYGAPTPGKSAVIKWFQRGNIPGLWLPVLLAYTEIDEGAPVSLAPYLERT